MNLPSGTVTFLFTDIEGSTQLWERYPQAMVSSLTRHHTLLGQVIEAHQGYVFQIVGDSICAAFHTASDGVEAAKDYLSRSEFIRLLQRIFQMTFLHYELRPSHRIIYLIG